jgi:hypothetical protein
MPKLLSIASLPLFFIGFACRPPTVVNPNYDLSTIRTVSIAPIADFPTFEGSGEIITRSLIHHLMMMGLNVVERDALGSIVGEAALSQSALSGEHYNLNLRPGDAVITCTITEFTNGNVIVIPITKEDKGKTVTTTTTREEPVVIEEAGGDKQVKYETVKTEETTEYAGSVTKTQRLEYIDSRVGLAIQMVHRETGEVLWSNSYWYNALNLSYAVDRCVAGAVKPLKKLLQD